jgi:NAD(P)-dependent dehydrogenase (short-subunit alcohol dehydrogenase family)
LLVCVCRPPAPIAMYAVSKTALLGLTKGLAAELGPEGITVNCVAPGIVPTKFSAALVADPELVSTSCGVVLLKAQACCACVTWARLACCVSHVCAPRPVDVLTVNLGQQAC